MRQRVWSGIDLTILRELQALGYRKFAVGASTTDEKKAPGVPGKSPMKVGTRSSRVLSEGTVAEERSL